MNKLLFTFRLIPLEVATANQLSLICTGGLVKNFIPDALPGTTLKFQGTGRPNKLLKLDKWPYLMFYL